MEKTKRVSIIIPCRDITEAYYCADKCTELEYPDFEIILLPDNDPGYRFNEAKIVPTGETLPSHKRDIGLQHATGEIIAFLDADAYPQPFWLHVVTLFMKQDDICGICGAGILPQHSTARERASDAILQILPFSYRVRCEMQRLVDDFPTFNLTLWKKDIDEAGGFSCSYLTGEDTHLCEKITKNVGKMILYDPAAYVYHHRRPLYIPFLKQIATYGRHRGYFFKNHPETSRRAIYLLPLLGVACIIFILLLALFWRF